MKQILFVCTGNTCRSPLAEAFFNKIAADGKVAGIAAKSAGIAALEGAPASENAAKAAKEAGVDLSSHRAQLVNRSLIDESSEIYCMSQNHVKMLKSIYPDASEKIRLFGNGIVDPFGGDIDVYRNCREQIIAEIKHMLKNRKE